MNDADIFLRSWYATIYDDAYNLAADFNMDGIVDDADRDIIAFSFQKRGTGMFDTVE